MKQGYVKVAAAVPEVSVANPTANTQEIIRLMKETAANKAKVVVFPELCISGYSCADLFLHHLLLEKCEEGLAEIAKASEGLDAIFFVGLPYEYRGSLYNVAAAVANGKVIGLIPKTYIPNYNEFYEARHFAAGFLEPVQTKIAGFCDVWFGRGLLFECRSMPHLTIGAEICEDLWTPLPPSTEAALAGATLLVNLSASDETTGKDVYRRNLVCGQSARLLTGYVYCSAGEGESTQDVVYSGHSIISENGALLAESKRFQNETIYTEIDVDRLIAERRKMMTFCAEHKEYRRVLFDLTMEKTYLTRTIDSSPFVPKDAANRAKRCEEILNIQSMGLKQRLKHTGCQNAVVGISGGLDSTLALLVTVRAFDLLGLPRKQITAVTMPGFGTTDRTYDNAVSMIHCLGADFKEIDIKEAVNVHFRDIGHDPAVCDVTYENSQARERTQILMDLANKTGGMVIGTGDLSELALGFATYNGDHMSMYGVNASVPKTLVRHLVQYCADTSNEELAKVLLDVLDTPVSPELLPPKEGEIAQKTEDIVGPYELHDFYLYYMLRFGFGPKKIFRLAKIAFAEEYDAETIYKWLQLFVRRFFTQQFKRSCLPDGPKVGTIAVSPRGDLRMPSDASRQLWMEELEEIEKYMK